jgi:hypothetical protein
MRSMEGSSVRGVAAGHGSPQRQRDALGHVRRLLLDVHLERVAEPVLLRAPTQHNNNLS